MARIAQVSSLEVLDSRGRPTLEALVRCDDGTTAAAMVPAGASRGRFEAVELRDHDPARYAGMGVLAAVKIVETVIGPAVIGLDPRDQLAVDRRLLELDPDPQKSKLGGNAILGVSLAAAHAGARVERVPLYRHIARIAAEEAREWASSEHGAGKSREPLCLPKPMVNMISGGLHAGGNLDFQDFMIQPRNPPSFAVGLEWIVRTYRHLGQLLIESGFEGRLVGDEGGFGPRLADECQAIEFVLRAIESAGLRPGEDMAIALDVAATQFYDDPGYQLRAPADTAASIQKLSSQQMIDRLCSLVERYPVESIEDGLAEEDWAGWQALTARLGKQVQLVGDDLFVTSPERLKRGIEMGVANAVLVKVNQIGTLSESLAVIRIAHQAGYRCVVSARSGETEDTTIADLAVGAGAEQIKIGSVVRSERLAKYNRLLRIAADLEAAPQN